MSDTRLYTTKFVQNNVTRYVRDSEAVHIDELAGALAEELVYSELETVAQTPIAAINEVKEASDALNDTIEALPDIHISTSEPSSSDGKNGDLWVVIEE